MSKKAAKTSAVSTITERIEVVDTEEVKETTDVSEEEKPTEDKQPRIYLGPSIPGVVRHANVFSGGNLPKKLASAVSEVPAMCRLIVPVSEAPELMKELNKEQSAAANIYKAVAKKYNL